MCLVILLQIAGQKDKSVVLKVILLNRVYIRVPQSFSG